MGTCLKQVASERSGVCSLCGIGDIVSLRKHSNRCISKWVVSLLLKYSVVDVVDIKSVPNRVPLDTIMLGCLLFAAIFLW